MRKILFLVILFVASLANAQTLVQSCGAINATNTASCTLTNVVAGHTVIVFAMTCRTSDAGCDVSASPALSASGNTLSSCGNQSSASHGNILCSFTCNAAGASTTVQITRTTGGASAIIGLEYSGLLTSSCLDATGAATNTTATPSVTTTGAVAQAQELVVTGMIDWDANHTATAGTGYTIQKQNNDATNGDMMAAEDNNTKTGLSGTQTGSFGGLGTDTKQLLIATFKATGGGGASAVSPAVVY